MSSFRNRNPADPCTGFSIKELANSFGCSNLLLARENAKCGERTKLRGERERIKHLENPLHNWQNSVAKLEESAAYRQPLNPFAARGTNATTTSAAGKRC